MHLTATLESGDSEHLRCDDCVKRKAKIFHHGPLVPKGKFGLFCAECWQLRLIFFDYYAMPKPLTEPQAQSYADALASPCGEAEAAI